jgi:hypothetical protein
MLNGKEKWGKMHLPNGFHLNLVYAWIAHIPILQRDFFSTLTSPRIESEMAKKVVIKLHFPIIASC